MLFTPDACCLLLSVYEFCSWDIYSINEVTKYKYHLHEDEFIFEPFQNLL